MSAERAVDRALWWLVASAACWTVGIVVSFAWFPAVTLGGAVGALSACRFAYWAYLLLRLARR